MAERRSQKSYLTTLSLVCRYWAYTFRPAIFYSLSLRSHRDFNNLVTILVPPVVILPPIAECIRRLDILVNESDLWGVSWLHRLILDLPKCKVDIKNPYRLTVNLTLENATMFRPVLKPSGAEARSFPFTFSALLPRSYPSSCLPLTILALANLRFRCIVDILRLVNGANWMFLSVKDIQVEKPMEDTYFPGLRRPKNTWNVYVEIANGALLDVEVALIIFRHTKKHLPVTVDAWNGIHDILLAWLPPLSGYSRLTISVPVSKKTGTNLRRRFISIS